MESELRGKFLFEFFFARNQCYDEYELFLVVKYFYRPQVAIVGGCLALKLFADDGKNNSAELKRSIVQ